VPFAIAETRGGSSTTVTSNATESVWPAKSLDTAATTVAGRLQVRGLALAA